jgi:hypothetical protein
MSFLQKNLLHTDFEINSKLIYLPPLLSLNTYNITLWWDAHIQKKTKTTEDILEGTTVEE